MANSDIETDVVVNTCSLLLDTNVLIYNSYWVIDKDWLYLVHSTEVVRMTTYINIVVGCFCN